MYYGEIKKNDIANGIGIRTTLFVSGCTHHCKGCFNPETWNFYYGKPFTAETEQVLLESLKPYYVTGLTLLGGEPLDPRNQKALLPFLRRVKELFPKKNIWCYTGYTLESDLLEETGRAYCETTDEILSLIDVLVDGPFVEELRDISLLFRGSSNQRLIDLPNTLQQRNVVLWEGESL